MGYSERSNAGAGSQSLGIGRVLQVTKGHQPDRFRIREDDTGVCRTPEDTSSPRFGTVRLQGSNGLLPIQRDRRAPEAPGYSVIRRASLRGDCRQICVPGSDAEPLRNSLIRRGNSIRKGDWRYRVLLWIIRLKVRILPPQPTPAEQAGLYSA